MKKNAIVTGANGNLGKAIVRGLLQADYRVIGTVRHDDVGSENEGYPNYEKYTLDVGNQKATETFIHYVTHKFGDIHFSALLVGGFGMNAFEDTTLDDLHQMITLNFETAFISSQAIFRQMKTQAEGGTIMLIGAKPALEKGASKGMTAYSLSKSLVIKLAEHISAEGAAHQVRASVVVPSVIDTPQNREAMPDANYNEWVSPEQIAEISVFLANQPATLLQDVVIKIYGES